MEDVNKRVVSDGVDKHIINDSEMYSIASRLIMRDLNNFRPNSVYTRYTKDEVMTYLSDPSRYSDQIRNAIIYIYSLSSHFFRLISYFAGLTDWDYTIEPYKLDHKKANLKTVSSNYKKTSNFISSMDIKVQLPKILTKCLKEDVCYVTTWITSENVTFQILPSEYCSISSIEGNAFNVTFNFAYFDSHSELLAYFPKEFRKKYNKYLKNKRTRWYELDAPNSFAIKLNDDIPEYPIPPFAGLLRSLYDIEDYAQMKNTKTALENYALLHMKFPMDEHGNYLISETVAERFWRNLSDVIPEEVGAVLAPMDIEKISFDKSNTGDVDTVSDAEQHMFTAAGVSSLIFNNEKASANALLLSIKADQAITYKLVTSIGHAINRILHKQSFGKFFSINFLDISTFNRKEMGDMYLKAASYGIPTISAYATSQGIKQEVLDGMSYLEGSVLGLQDIFRPIQSSTQMSSSDLESEESNGRPKKDIGELSDSRERNSENE